MSLKTVHLMFVAALTALTLGLGIWKARDYSETKALADLIFAAGSFAVAGLVVWYGRQVFRKLKSISYL